MAAHFIEQSFANNDYSKESQATESTSVGKLDTNFSINTFGGEINAPAVPQNLNNSSPMFKKRGKGRPENTRSYIKAMKSLQEKLDQKDKLIENMAKKLDTQKIEIEKLEIAPESERSRVPKFGGEGRISTRRSNAPFYLEISKINAVQPSECMSKDSYFLKENVNPNFAKNREDLEISTLRSNCFQNNRVSNLEGEVRRLKVENKELVGDNYRIAKELDELSNRYVTLERKLRVAKERNGRLNSELEDSLNKNALLEELNFQIVTEKNELKQALNNLEELVDILSSGNNLVTNHTKDKDFLDNMPGQAQAQSLDKDVFNLTSTIRGEFESRYSSVQSKQPGTERIFKDGFNSLVKRTEAEISATESHGVPHEELLVDIVNHVLLNQELTLQHLDLYNHMKDRFKENVGFFNILEDNYEYLKETRMMIIRKNQDMSENYVYERIDDDVKTIDNLLSLIRGILAIGETPRLK